MKCPKCDQKNFTLLSREEHFAQCDTCGRIVCTACQGLGGHDTPFSGSDPTCEECAGEGSFDPETVTMEKDSVERYLNATRGA